MIVTATHKSARISPLKARDVARQIQGRSVTDAINILDFTPRKAAYLIGKTLNSAVANAEDAFNLVADSLQVLEATVTDGPTYRRFKPRARGSASAIRRRTCHIRVVLGEEEDVEAYRFRHLNKGDEKRTTEPKAKSKSEVKSEKPVPKKTEAKPKATPEPAPEPEPEPVASGRVNDARRGWIFTEAPEAIDDLKEISGVGEVLEQKLHDFGIYRFEQIANWSPDNVAEFDELLDFKDRINRDEWIDQATKLYQEKYG